MPITKANIARARELSSKLQAHSATLHEEDPDFLDTMQKLQKLNLVIDDFDKPNRKVDDSGKLKEDAAGRLPARVDSPGASGSSFHFEPSVEEVQMFVQRNPELAKRLGLGKLFDIRRPEAIEQVADPDTGRVSGRTVTPAATHLDLLSSEDQAYKDISDELWRRRVEEAKKKGENVRRYRDVRLDDDPVDFARGGAEYILDRRIAPYATGVYNAASMGLARPLYDTARDLADYELGQRGYNTDWIPPRSEEVVARSPGSYIAGSVVGSVMPGNPSNAIQSAASTALGYEGAQLMRPVISAAVGGAQNAAEGAVQDFATAGANGASVGDAAVQAAANMPLNAAVGTVGGGVFDVAGNAIGAVREGYRTQDRLRNLKVLEDAGGRTSIPAGVVPSPEIREFVRLSNAPGAIGSAGDFAAREVSPHIQESIHGRVRDERIKTEQQTREYFNHPDYRDITVSAKPAVDSLVEMAERGWVSAPVTGDPMNVNPPEIKKLGGVLRDYTQTITVPRGDAPSRAAESGGTVLSGELANRLYGFDEARRVPPGHDVVVVPFKLNAEELTGLEGRIDEELNMAAARGSNEDPVWTRYNERVKEMRDQFPLYQDEAGNLVGIPPPESEPQPFSRDPGATPSGGAPPGGGVDVLPPPRAVVDKPPMVPPEAERGLGPDQGPRIPANPFDPRPLAPVSRPPEAPPVQPQPTVGVRGDYAPPPRIEPVDQPGIGPGQDRPIPPNPFDASHLMPVSREVVAPLEARAPVDVTGGEYSPPADIPLIDQRGIGPQMQPTRQGPLPPNPFEAAVEPHPVQLTEGDYNQPRNIEPEPPPPSTQRGPGGAQPAPIPSEEATPLSLLAGNKLAMPAEPRANDGLTEPAMRPPPRPDEMPPRRDMSWEERQAEIARGEQMVELPPEVQDAIDRGVLPDEEGQRAMRERAGLRPNDGNTEPARAANSEEIRSDAEWQEQQILHAAEAYEAGMKPIVDADGAVIGVQPLGAGEAPDRTVMKLAERIRMRQAEAQRGVADESLPAPSPREWKAATQEGEDFHDAVFGPGREARAADSDRAAKLAEQTTAMEEALAQINDIDRRLGPMEPKTKEAMLLDYISRKLGREVTREDLVQAGILAGSLGVAATADEDSPLQDVATAAGVLGGGFGGGRRGKRGKSRTSPPGGPKSLMPEPTVKPKARPKQLEATLDDGRKVKGFSALRRNQHTEKTDIANAERRVGATQEENVHKRVINFNQQKGMQLEDEALFNEAKNIGKEKELRTAAGASVYPSLKQRAWAGASDGAGAKIADFLMLRLDPILGAAAGVERNPFARGPSSTLEAMQQELLADPAKRLLQLTRGAPATKYGEFASDAIRDSYGDPVRDYILDLYRKHDDEERRKEKAQR